MENVTDRPPERSILLHYTDGADPQTWCGLAVGHVAPAGLTLHKAQVTCPGCLHEDRMLAALDPAPATHTPSGMTDLRELDRCACGAGPGQPCQVDGEVRAVPHASRPRLAVPERRTVSLEVLTPILVAAENARCIADADDPADIPTVPAGARVGIVLRLDDHVLAVPETDVPWAASGHRAPADVLEVLLRQARFYADDHDGAELLMPTPDVLAVLDGSPDATFWTERIELQARFVRPGWLVVSLVTEDGEDLVTTATDCTDPDCVWHGDCVMVAAGTEPVHFTNWSNVEVRIPAAVTR